MHTVENPEKGVAHIFAKIPGGSMLFEINF
jgi:hypothetical protein